MGAWDSKGAWLIAYSSEQSGPDTGFFPCLTEQPICIFCGTRRRKAEVVGPGSRFRTSRRDPLGFEIIATEVHFHRAYLGDAKIVKLVVCEVRSVVAEYAAGLAFEQRHPSDSRFIYGLLVSQRVLVEC